LNRSVAVKI